MLKPENRPIYDKVKDTLDATGKCILITHPGRGKSFITEEYIEEANPGNIWCICPSAEVKQQWMGDHNSRINTITYQMLSQMDEVPFDAADLVIIDEAHHVGAEQWGKKLIEIIESASPNGRKVLALTADPIRWSDRQRNIAEEYFDDCQVYGPGLGDSINEGFLQPFTYVLSMYGIPTKINQLKQRASKLPPEQRDEIFTLIGQMQYLPEIVTDTVKCLQAYTPSENHKIIVFCAKIRDIPEAQKLIKSAYPGMEQFVIHSKQTVSKNATQFEKWKSSGNAVIFNVGKIAEGVHVNRADIVIMFRKTGSPSLYIQQIGRIMSPDNPHAIVFDIVSNAGTIAKVLRRAGLEETEQGQIIPIAYGDKTGNSVPKQIIIQNAAAPAVKILEKIENLMKSCRPWTKEELKYIEDNLNLLTPDEMHDQYLKNRTPTAIKACIQKHYGSQLAHSEKEPVPWTDIRTKWAIQLYQDGNTLDYICNLMSVDKDNLIQHLQDNGITVHM